MVSDPLAKYPWFKLKPESGDQEEEGEPHETEAPTVTFLLQTDSFGTKQVTGQIRIKKWGNRFNLMMRGRD